MQKPRSDQRTELALREASVQAFTHPADVIEQEVAEDLMARLAQVLTPVHQFVARGRLGGTMAVRSWIVLHETRLDLIAGESIEDCAKREGISVSRVYELIKEFRACVPNYRPPHQKSAETKARMSAAHRRARAYPGKESFSGEPDQAGSAHAAHSTTRDT